ncbi:hypothetical protein HQ585_01765 [candidate division KSB1 bacterium]|nr:hypothetical protein [candidate division KSB1 bacterium]
MSSTDYILNPSLENLSQKVQELEREIANLRAKIKHLEEGKKSSPF